MLLMVIYMSNIQKSFICLIIFCFGIIFLYYRLYDKKLRNNIIKIGILLIFWMLTRIIKALIIDENSKIFFWYLYYIPMIMVPYLYYKSANYLLDRKRKYNIIVLIISIMLIIMVLTNNYHSWVFTIEENFSTTGKYTHNIGYYIICVWIFYLFIKSIILLIIKKIKETGFDYKIFMPIILIIIGITYTILYVKEIEFIRRTNMSNILGILMLLGVELELYLDLVPNNNKYKKLFLNSSLPISIISLDGKVVYNTKNINKIPKKIIKDIQNKTPKSIYKQENIIYNINYLKNEYVVTFEDLTNIKILEKQVKDQNIKLLEQQDALKEEKELTIKLNELEIKNKILTKLEKNIKNKKDNINKILKNEELNPQDLLKIKMFISYCKRESALIISEFNNEIFNNEGIGLIIDELIKDFKYSNNSCAFIVDNIKVKAKEMATIYEIIFSFLENISHSAVYISIFCREYLTIKINVDNVKKIKNKLKIEKNVLAKELVCDGETTYIFKIMED